MPADPDHQRELLLVDLIDNCPLCTANFPIVCSIHRIQAMRLAIQRSDAAGALS
jgi:hypothetical protein